MKNYLTLLFLFFAEIISAQNLVRGPYIQMGTQTSVVIRWRTDQPTNSRVTYGTSFSNYTFSQSNFTPKTEHEVQLTNLLPNTKYFYTIGSSDLQFQGDVNNHFYTLPLDTSKDKIRFLALGDCGIVTPNQVNLRTQFMRYAAEKPFHFTVLLGDNAYSLGKDDEYQFGFFEPYKDLLKKTVLYPALGNHDYYSMTYENEVYKGAYLDIFTNPTKGELGGVPSGSEAYYSYDYGNVHFIVLDSYGAEIGQTKRLYDTLSPQIQWLKKDLAANKKRWTVAYWHHPPYDKADYDTDTVEELYLIRENVLRYLERNGVDLVLCGHSHTYQRSYLIRRHYGKAATFKAKLHGVSMSSGKYDGTTNSCPYIKRTGSGTVYVVAGSSAQIRDRRAADFPHPAMSYSNFDKAGALIVEVEDNRLDAKWLCEDGVIRDNFTIFKDVNKVQNISIKRGENLNLSASWVGNYLWQNGNQIRQVGLNNVNNSQKVFVTDDKRCLADTFKISITPTLLFENSQVNVFPNPAEDYVDISLEIPSDNEYELNISDLQGNILQSFPKEYFIKGNHQKRLPFNEKLLNTDLVLITLTSENQRITKKVKILR